MGRAIFICLILAFAFFSCGRNYTVINKGVGGNTSSDLLQRVEQDVLEIEPDIVILMVGTNDMLNSKKFISYSTYTSNLQAMINTYKNAGITTVLMSPPPVDTAYLFKRHAREAFPELPNTKIDSIQKIMQQLAIENGVYFIDINGLFKKMGAPNDTAHSLIMNYHNSQKEDGVHPTKEGYQLIAKEVFNSLQQNNLLNRETRILCFGDSITFGVFMKGAGTSTGDTYPAYLQELLDQL